MNNKDSEFAGFITGLVLAACAAIIIFATAIQPYYRKQAIKGGAAEWVLNPVTGEVAFKWKEQK